MSMEADFRLGSQRLAQGAHARRDVIGSKKPAESVT